MTNKDVDDEQQGSAHNTGESRQVPLHSFSVHGSRVSGSSRLSDKSKFSVSLIELKERHLREKMEQQIKELQEKHKSELLAVRQELETARLAEKLEDKLSVGSIASEDGRDRVLEFVEKHSEWGVQQKNGPCLSGTAGFGGLENEHKMTTSTSSRITANIDLPKVELLSFDGRPTMYWRFIRQFQIYVASKTNDDGQRLLYLLHYCKGKARSAIEDCIMLPPKIGYDRACTILKDLFGRSHEVARSLLDGLLEGLSMNNVDADVLSCLSIRMESCMIALEQMGYTADLNSLSTLEQIVKELPYSLQNKWAETVDHIAQNEREPNFSELTEFISAMARVARSRFGQLANRSRKISRPVQSIQSSSRRPPSSIHNVHLVNNNSDLRTQLCVICAGKHPVPSCSSFVGFNTQMRWDKARRYGLCFICLKGSHRASDCNNKTTCDVGGCEGRHHKLLHVVKRALSTQHEPVAEGHCGATRLRTDGVSLGLLPVKLRAGVREIVGYALLDNGSDTTLLKASALRQLGLNQQRNHSKLNTLSGSTEANFVSDAFQVMPLNEMESVCVEQAVVISELPVHKPVRDSSERMKRWPHLADLPVEYIDGEVLLLIGCDIPEAHWVLDQRLGGRKNPYAVRTLLGWVIFGPSSFASHEMKSVNCLIAEDSDLMHHVRRIYNAEFADAQLLDQGISVDDTKAIAMVESGTTFVDGHFVVPLPWRESVNTGMGNYAAALTRLNSLKRRLIKDEALRVRYAQTMRTTIEKGYAVPVPEEQLHCDFQPRWYLPHHAVLNPKKPDKLRIVLDCAAKHKGRSLNDMLYQGPDTTANLVGILLRFRKQRVAVTADIEEMFMQVKVPKHDRGALRFLWWPKGDLLKDPEEYQMTAHPFGATSSPFCANFALNRTAREFGSGYERAVLKAIEENFYVDDCLASFTTCDEALGFAKEITELLGRGGFKLTKWSSNSPEVAESLSKDSTSTNLVQLPRFDSSCQRALGVQWDTTRDVFTFQFQLLDKPLTRRGILSSVSSWFDPLGLVAPLCLPAKQLLQTLCKSKMGWDQPLSAADVSVWESWVRFVRCLEVIKIPRSLRNEVWEEGGRTELHLFCDASETGYGAVAYAWCVSPGQAGYSVLLCSKSRVAPVKPVSIPRLELSAAVLGIKIGELVKRALSEMFSDVWYWTDSMIVKYYIENTSTRFSTFVANRLATIHQYSTVSQWRHIQSERNIADLTSRGITTKRELEKWLEGPMFLQSYIPQAPSLLSVTPDGVEMKRTVAHVHTATSSTNIEQLLYRYSQWSKLLKSVAWIIRFVSYIKIMYSSRNKGTLSVGNLSVEEIEEARRKILRMVQNETLGELMVQGTLQAARNGNMMRSLRKLCPVMIDGLLCVGGRLIYANYSSHFKHPVILPNRHFVTDLIIRFYHCREGHSGSSHVLSAIREKYWIVKGIGAVKRVIGQCMVCRKMIASAGQQMMAPLPLCRVQKGWCCFKSVGVDYFGPLSVRKGRGSEKKYGCVFTCLQTRAVHLEIAGSLNTDSFILCLLRFIGRRGRPSEIYSDNGSNFVGAVSELKNTIKRWDGHKINDRLACDGIKWFFNPPSSSHRGGVWERMIRSIRRLLLVLTKEQLMHEETLSTCFVEIERILNSRPLVPCLSDDNERKTLSPNSLLLLTENDQNLEGFTMTECYTRRWRQVNHFADTFWRRWMREYLPTLQVRQKWLSKHRNFKTGDIVLIASENTTRGKWPMGIIDAVETDEDGLVRTAVVHAVGGKIRRDVRRLCLLEGAD